MPNTRPSRWFRFNKSKRGKTGDLDLTRYSLSTMPPHCLKDFCPCWDCLDEILLSYDGSPRSWNDTFPSSRIQWQWKNNNLKMYSPTPKIAIKFPLPRFIFGGYVLCIKMDSSFPGFRVNIPIKKKWQQYLKELSGLDPKLTVGMPNKNPAMLQMFLFQSIQNWMGPNPNRPYQVSCNRAIRYSGFFRVRSGTVRPLEISWIQDWVRFWGFMLICRKSCWWRKSEGSI